MSPQAPGQLPLEPQTKRSAIPRVIGILATVFAPFGLLITLGLTFGIEDDIRAFGLTTDDLGGLGTWIRVSFLLGLALFAIHLCGGIMAICYARWAPRTITLYAVFALALAIADVLVPMSTTPANLPAVAHGEVIMPRIALAVFAVVWPIVALVLMNTRRARTACAPN